MRFLLAFSTIILGLPSLSVRAADNSALPAAVREAVDARRVRDSNLVGDSQAKIPFRGLASNGGILVGLEVGVGPGGVIAVRPIYRGGDREWFGASAGNFLAHDLTSTVRLTARPGYAVGAITVNATADHLIGLSVISMRIQGATLDPADHTESEWAGTAGAVHRLDGNGLPVAGLFGRTTDDRVVGIGLVYADLPVPVVAEKAGGLQAATPPAESDPERASRVGPVAALGGVVVVGLIVGFYFRRRKVDEEEQICIVHPSPFFYPPLYQSGEITRADNADAFHPTPLPVADSAEEAIELLMR